MNSFRTAVRKIIIRFSEDQITVYSAQAAYFIIVSMIPFATLLVSLIQFIIPDEQVIVVNTIITLLPGSLGDTLGQLADELFNSPTISIVSLAALISLWTASRGIMGLERGFHVVYHVTERDNYLVRRLRCILYTFVFLLAVILALGLLVLRRTISSLLSENHTILYRIFRFLFSFRFLLAIVVFVVAFSLAYRTLSGVHCTFLEALPGVLVSTIGWIVFSFFFSIYITYFSRYTSLYGTMGALLLLFLWIYACVLILLVGAEVNVYLTEYASKKPPKQLSHE
ncbi:MAG: YihY/virulence factor BrkB family protein [Lachnospiraceae bacterium]|nr:YihY/virulence factor BrkB family protein [Lachnospiraceae bacterium]